MAQPCVLILCTPANTKGGDVLLYQNTEGLLKKAHANRYFNAEASRRKCPPAHK